MRDIDKVFGLRPLPGAGVGRHVLQSGELPPYFGSCSVTTAAN
jgi:hypothetical protein